MKNFIWIFNHYFKRSILDSETLLLMIIPLGFIILNGAITQSTDQLIDGYDPVISYVSPMFMLAFQFFGAGLIAYWLHRDFRGGLHWRLHAAPIDQRIFFLALALGSWIVMMVQGLLIIAISSIFLNAHWGNWGMTLGILMVISLMSQLIGLLIFYFSKSTAGANTLMYVIGFGMMILSGYLVGPLGHGELMTFIRNHTPLNLGTHAIINAGIFGEGMEETLSSLGILVGMALVLAVVTWVLGRRKFNDNL